MRAYEITWTKTVNSLNFKMLLSIVFVVGMICGMLVSQTLWSPRNPRSWKVRRQPALRAKKRFIRALKRGEEQEVQRGKRHRNVPAPYDFGRIYVRIAVYEEAGLGVLLNNMGIPLDPFLRNPYFRLTARYENQIYQSSLCIANLLQFDYGKIWNLQ